MRLHQLSVTAFGPFAGTEVVDFDELNDAGLFLLTGPTGAGKSTLLDAVCFALYGSVPGVRGVKTLKSQHAAAHVAPEVVLDFTVRGRRFVVRRTPEWSRPKKRGDGLLTEKASATIVETTGGGETFHSSRAAEVGLLVNDLMGMTASQFVQVALLPQGEFQTFLRASSQERHDVLQRLFRTDRFARIEDWVHEHSRDLNQRASRDRAAVQRLVDSVAERCGTETPEELCGESLARSAVEGQVQLWAGECLDGALAALDLAQGEHAVAGERQREAALAHDAALRADEHAARRAQALEVLQSLSESEPAAQAARAALEAAARGERCLPLLGVLDEAQAVVQQAVLDHDSALTRLNRVLAECPGVPFVDFPDAALDLPQLGTAEPLARLLAGTQAQVTRLETLLPREAAALAAARQLVDVRSRLDAAQEELAVLSTRAEQIPPELAALSRRTHETTARAARREAVQLSLAAATRRRDAAAELVRADADVTRRADEHRDARDRALTARERRQELTTRRLAGMAAELASRLADGEACEVCGSSAHPRPARPAADHVSEAAQDAAEQRVVEATEELDSSTRALQDAEHRRDTLRVAADGRTADEAGAEVSTLQAGVTDADAAASELSALQEQLSALQVEQDGVAARMTSAASQVADLRTAVAVLEQTVRDVAREIAEATGGIAGRSLRPTVEALRLLVSALRDAHRAAETAERAAARVDELEDQAARAVAEHGFDTVDALRSVLLSRAEQHQITEQLTERDRIAARAHAVLQETAALPAACDAPALPVLAAGLAEADALVTESGRRLHSAEERVAALRSLLSRLEAALVTWAPLRDAALQAEAMSRLVRGIGHDNQLQMRLSAYVLATRLDQVVAAANERLGHMRDQRYLLQRTDRAARKGSQAGLGLEIVDQWTGDARSPATLSGGETFVVSLSLALGLADVVTQEAGGTEIDTLFVDEGFGTLDADTLDDVMDRLDGLRAGGRTVGVVSHVSELRNRIPTQVHVRKGRSGSSVAVATLVG